MKFGVASDEFYGGSAVEVVYFWFVDVVECVGVEGFFFLFGCYEGYGSEDSAGFGVVGVGCAFGAGELGGVWVWPWLWRLVQVHVGRALSTMESRAWLSPFAGRVGWITVAIASSSAYL